MFNTLKFDGYINANIKYTRHLIALPPTTKYDSQWTLTPTHTTLEDFPTTSKQDTFPLNSKCSKSCLPKVCWSLKYCVKCWRAINYNVSWDGGWVFSICVRVQGRCGLASSNNVNCYI